MPKQWIAAFDQGTTSSRTVLFDRKGGAVAKGQVEFRQLYPRPGWVEHDPRDIFESQLASWRAALAAAGGSAGDVAAIGIANQRETVLVWDRKTGEPIYNAIVWQCRRTAQDCERLKSECGDLIYQKTGLFVDAYFSASKIAWLLGNVPDARRRAERGELLFGTVDCYLIWKLTDGRVHATDRTNASRTMLFNIDTLDWDDDLCRLFGVPKCMLPKVLPVWEHCFMLPTVFGKLLPVQNLLTFSRYYDLLPLVCVLCFSQQLFWVRSIRCCHLLYKGPMPFWMDRLLI